MIKRLKVWWLKRQGAKHFCIVDRKLTSLNCGMNSGLQLPSITYHARKCDEYLDKLQALGEPVPKFRFATLFK